jgi:hypothetical protein
MRSVSDEGKSSFLGFGIHDCIPALHSMLSFPQAAKNLDTHTLVWKALALAPQELTEASFLSAINGQLNILLETKLEEFRVLSTISIAHPKNTTELRLDGCAVNFLHTSYPPIFSDRTNAITSQRVPVGEAKIDYTRFIAVVDARSPQEAMTAALRAVDLQRAIWCLYGNVSLEIVGQSWKPINVVKLGPIHTVHRPDGALASESVWFEPNYAEVPTYSFDDEATAAAQSRKAIDCLEASNYRDRLVDALLRFVRALDESNQNTAFIKLWSAAESLLVPERADYEKFVRRCAFLYQEGEYHRQLLEHLREYRNKSVHAGDDSELAKTHCFQLQSYFRDLMFFHLRYSADFTSLEEANSFLDLPPQKIILNRRKQLLDKAISFLSPPGGA